MPFLARRGLHDALRLPGKIPVGRFGKAHHTVAKGSSLPVRVHIPLGAKGIKILCLGVSGSEVQRPVPTHPRQRRPVGGSDAEAFRDAQRGVNPQGFPGDEHFQGRRCGIPAVQLAHHLHSPVKIGLDAEVLPFHVNVVGGQIDRAVATLLAHIVCRHPKFPVRIG